MGACSGGLGRRKEKVRAAGPSRCTSPPRLVVEPASLALVLAVLAVLSTLATLPTEGGIKRVLLSSPSPSPPSPHSAL
jgi:hypothetical protein